MQRERKVFWYALQLLLAVVVMVHLLANTVKLCLELLVTWDPQGGTSHLLFVWA